MIGGKIFGLGLSRTGTTTLAESLKLSGYNILHYPTSLNQMKNLKGYHGANDIPVCAYFKTLDRLYPNSKFILTIREKHSWQSAIEKFMTNRKVPTDGWALEVREKVYGSKEFNKEAWFDAYDKHHDNVMNYFKNRPEDILAIDIIGGDSPSKLYEFLNVTKRPLKKFDVYNKGKKG